MFRFCCIALFICVILQTSCTVYSQCTEKEAQSGTISYSFYSSRYSRKEQCWDIPVPESKFAKLSDFSWSMNSQSCDYAYLRIHLNDTDEKYTFCGSDSYTNLNPITALSSIRIDFSYHEASSYSRSISISLQYVIRDIECIRKGSFKCSTHSCIPKSKVCDGTEDCQNGIDEIGCDTGVLSVVGVDKARAQAISWLKSQRTPFWGWHDNTPRAITALFLSNGANFNGSNLEEEVMAKQSEVKIAVGLLKNPISNEVLSIFINSLLVMCHNPRHFYGQNLVTQLKKQVDSSETFMHPIAYLTLCNANESWPLRAEKDLLNVLNSSSNYHFVKDIQSYAVMAVECYSNNSNIKNKVDMTALLSHVKKTVEQFKNTQLYDGSFGNVQTTSLVTQALISSGLGNAKDWNLNATVKYLIKELNSTVLDFPTVYLTLPVFNGKSLSHIFKVNCTANPRSRVRASIKSEIDDYIGPKIKIQFSLFIGDKKDIIHTLFLRVPENYTAYQVMQYAEEEDYKYKFEWKRIMNKMYVYKIGKVINDPEVGKFWLVFSGSTKSAVYQQTTSSPDEIIMKDEGHLVMWYKTASI